MFKQPVSFRPYLMYLYYQNSLPIINGAREVRGTDTSDDTLQLNVGRKRKLEFEMR